MVQNHVELAIELRGPRRERPSEVDALCRDMERALTASAVGPQSGLLGKLRRRWFGPRVRGRVHHSSPGDIRCTFDIDPGTAASTRLCELWLSEAVRALVNVGRVPPEADGDQAIEAGEFGEWIRACARLARQAFSEPPEAELRLRSPGRTLSEHLAPEYVKTIMRVAAQWGEPPVTAATRGADRERPVAESPSEGVARAREVEEPPERSSNTDDSEHAVIQEIRHLLDSESPLLARKAAEIGAERFPDSTPIREYLAILRAPATQIKEPSSARSSLARNRAWLRSEQKNYTGKWIALQNGSLVAVAETLAELRQKVDLDPSVFVTKIA